jgi:hypothetical protein
MTFLNTMLTGVKTVITSVLEMLEHLLLDME